MKTTTLNEKAIAAYRAEVLAMSPRERQAALKDAQRGVVGAIVRFAVLVSVCDELGEKITISIPDNMRLFLGGVYHGKLNPDAVMYVNSPAALNLLSQLKPAEQQRLIKAGTVPVRQANGKAKIIRLSNLTAEDAARVLDKTARKVKAVAQQVARNSDSIKSSASKQVSAWVSLDEYKRMSEMAHERGISINALLRQFIEKGLAS